MMSLEHVIWPEERGGYIRPATSSTIFSNTIICLNKYHGYLPFLLTWVISTVFKSESLLYIRVCYVLSMQFKWKSWTILKELFLNEYNNSLNLVPISYTVKVEIFALHLFLRFSRSNLAAWKKRANMFILCLGLCRRV